MQPEELTNAETEKYRKLFEKLPKNKLEQLQQAKDTEWRKPKQSTFIASIAKELGAAGFDIVSLDPGKFFQCIPFTLLLHSLSTPSGEASAQQKQQVDPITGLPIPTRTSIERESIAEQRWLPTTRHPQRNGHAATECCRWSGHLRLGS